VIKCFNREGKPFFRNFGVAGKGGRRADEESGKVWRNSREPHANSFTLFLLSAAFPTTHL